MPGQDGASPGLWDLVCSDGRSGPPGPERGSLARARARAFGGGPGPVCAAERARARADPGGRAEPGCSPGGQCHKKREGGTEVPPNPTIAAGVHSICLPAASIVDDVLRPQYAAYY